MHCQICNNVFPALLTITDDCEDYHDVCPGCKSGEMFIDLEYSPPVVSHVKPVVKKWAHETPFKSAEQREQEEDVIINAHINSKEFT
jgi:hypothetical protein